MARAENLRSLLVRELHDIADTCGVAIGDETMSTTRPMQHDRLTVLSTELHDRAQRVYRIVQQILKVEP